MPKFSDTRMAGTRAEESVREVLSHFADRVYSNVRLPSLFTAGGTTEIDLLAAFNDAILVVEVKNVRVIQGNPLQSFWTMEGANTGEVYNALNVFTQNRIHIRAIKDRWFELHSTFPIVLSIIVVPNGCEIEESLREGGIITVNELAGQLAALKDTASFGPECQYALDFLVATYNKKKEGRV